MDSSGNRLTAISPDNHQPWLWFMHFFSMAFIVLAACMRAWMKWRQAALSDALLFTAHLLYIGYWLVLLFSLISALGKSENITSTLQESKAAKLVFASRILLVIILGATKVSTMFLIREIFTRDATKWWFRAIVGAATVQAAFGALLLSIECSPARILDAKNNDHCSGNGPRWIVFTVFEALLECLMVIPVAIIVMRLQTNLQKKIWAITVFVCRLVVWVPMWMHLAFYLRFLRSGRNNIDIVPTMITEELWVALALVLTSTPVLMRVAKKFTTSGITLSTSKAYGSRESSSNQKKTGFRPDDVTNSSQVDTHRMRNLNEGASIESRAESQVGILRQVDFQISSESKDLT
ncbi:hypothetical protein GJ744_004638 [Endocarpon pusillum]|uniref:Rhodopsin domain-containing protein n=1 Tax=Endocarpon pusillum TaxID=364733 RepID=A0A8H7E5Q5_9EURO|nr:hypothetical protein GJ744_004638 [Endocarpon pusillum]